MSQISDPDVPSILPISLHYFLQHWSQELALKFLFLHLCLKPSYWISCVYKNQMLDSNTPNILLLNLHYFLQYWSQRLALKSLFLCFCLSYSYWGFSVCRNQISDPSTPKDLIHWLMLSWCLYLTQIHAFHVYLLLQHPHSGFVVILLSLVCVIYGVPILITSE